MTGKVGKTGIAFLSAPDDTGDATAWFNIARIRQDVGKDSLAGLTYTDRTAAAGFNRVAGGRRAHRVQEALLRARPGRRIVDRPRRRPRSARRCGRASSTARRARWGFNYKLTGFGEHFETQSGYVPRNNIVEGRASNRLTYYGARGSRVESFSGFLSLNRIWEYADFGDAGAIEGGGSLNLNSVLRGGWARERLVQPRTSCTSTRGRTTPTRSRARPTNWCRSRCRTACRTGAGPTRSPRRCSSGSTAASA